MNWFVGMPKGNPEKNPHKNFAKKFIAKFLDKKSWIRFLILIDNSG